MDNSHFVLIFSGFYKTIVDNLLLLGYKLVAKTPWLVVESSQGQLNKM